MTALVRIPYRETMLAVLVVRSGLGWRVGIGRVATGRIDGGHESFAEQKEAAAAAIELADSRDLIVLQCDAALNASGTQP